MRFRRVNAFLAPQLDWVVTGWRQAVATDDFRSADGYRGPLYLVLTAHDGVVLVHNGPDDVPLALDIVCRFPLEGRIHVDTATGDVRRATPVEQAEALRRLRADQPEGSGHVIPMQPVWMAGSVGFCVHHQPWLVSLFQFIDGRCGAAVSSTRAQRIPTLGEE